MESTDPISMTYGQAVDLTSRIEQTLPLTGAGAPTTTTPAWYLGQTYLDTSTNETYYCVERPASGTTGFTWLKLAEPGRVRILTSADVNYPASNPTQIALWLLEPGIYNSDGNVTLRFDTDPLSATLSTSEPIWIGETIYSNQLTKTFLYRNDEVWYTRAARAEDGHRATGKFKSLTPPTIVQATGNSTTSVMSQDAATKMVYADSSTQRRISIGGSIEQGSLYSIALFGTTANDGAIAIGMGSSSRGIGSVAIGRGASASVQGQFDIGSTSTSYGYNSSNYRLLTGLYDGQSDHDAVTVGQLNTAIAGVTGAEEITSEDWSALWQ